MMPQPVYQAHEQRVIDELAQNDERLAKLDAFIETNPIFKQMDSIDQFWQLVQRHTMRELSHILNQRILRFTPVGYKEQVAGQEQPRDA